MKLFSRLHLPDDTQTSVATYTLHIIRSEPEQATWDEAEKRVLADLPAKMEALEEQLNELLPDGFRAEIRS